jgi:HK97 family phage major capsid protein
MSYSESELRQRLQHINEALLAAAQLLDTPKVRAAVEQLRAQRTAVETELREDHGPALDGLTTRNAADVRPADRSPAARAEHGFGADGYARAFEQYIRRGVRTMDPADVRLLEQSYVEHRDWSAGSDAAGGYAVPSLFLDKLTESQKALAAVLEVSNVLDTDDGAPLEWPSLDDTGVSGEIIAEAAAHNVDATTPFGTRTLGAYAYSSKIIKVSRQLLMDSRIELAPVLARMFGKRIARAFNVHATTGTGTGQPIGMLDATLGFGLGATAASATALVYNDLVNAVHGVDPEYRNENTAWMMNDAVLAAIRKLADNTNKPLISDPVTAGAPVRVLGYPVFLNPHMSSTFTTGQKLALFGDFRAGYVVRRAGPPIVLRLEELYAANLQVGFITAQRLDARPDDLGAVKYLKLA